MKNIHLLPTDKPSRLFKNLKLDTWDASKEYLEDTTYLKNHNIYITDDSEIKDGYYLDLTYNIVMQAVFYPSSDKNGKKIILTDNKDLIKDGVQAIDDDFLEWLCNNPSCEWVEVLKDKCLDTSLMCDCVDEPCRNKGYKIIIPKEELKQTVQEYEQQGLEKHSHELEPKQDLEKEMFELEQELDILSHLRWHNSKPKQETLEEVAEKILLEEDLDLSDYDKRHILKAMVNIAKWQAERMYSEEDMLEASKYGYNFHKTTQFPEQDFEDSCIRNTKQWLKQFKK